MDQNLLLICQQLEAKGLTPSIGLLRSRSTRPLSIPEAVKAVKEWQHLRSTLDPKSLSAMITDQSVSSSEDPLLPTNKVSLEKRLTALENEIALIRRELTNLKS